MLLSRTFLLSYRVRYCRRAVSRHKRICVSSVKTQLFSSASCCDRTRFSSSLSYSKVFGTHQANFATVSLDNLLVTREENMTSLQEKPFRRLPTEVIPYDYEITLTPDLECFTLEGYEDIHIEVRTPTNVIVLNCLDIAIKRAIYKGDDGREIQARMEYVADEEIVKLVFPEELPPGRGGMLSLEFYGKINDSMKGFYRSKYAAPDGRVAYAAVTQFESTDARRCFPCWDEPALKASFTITLKVEPGQTALSNMPVESRLSTSSHEILKFQKTPIMSTYLVAVVVGEFDYLEDKTTDGTLVRVYTPKSKKEQGRFALEAATKVLPYYNQYFGISYPLPKMDLIAIADFCAGAMENWGLVTYRETCLLVDPENTSTVQRQWIALVVAHELAHQWFGNLVTMEWWTHLWLNEGYASFVEYLCVAHLFPDYDIWTQFVTDTYARALELDALKNSHPIEVAVGHPSEIDEIFDEISYNKGASVIRMLHSYIGDEDFRKGMNIYLERHSYANAETEDLWSALEEASNKPVRDVMTTWTKQQGFPVLKVDQRQEGNDRVLSLSQERFLADGSTDPDNSLWMIPVSVSTARAPEESAITTIMSERTKEIVIKDVPEGSWIKINPGTIGFYRTRYSPEALSLMMPAIEDRSIPPLDRLGLLDDLSAMVQAGHASTVEVLRLMQAFQQEDNYTVWVCIINSLGKPGLLVSHLEINDRFKAFGRTLLKDAVSRLGWDPKSNDGHLDRLLRSLLLGRMADYGDKDTLAEARRRFDKHVSGKATLPADLRSPVYRAVLSSSEPEVFHSMFTLYRRTELHEEKNRILRAFGAIKDEKLLGKVLEFSMSDEVRTQDTLFAIMSLGTSHKGRNLAWQFFKDHHADFVKRYAGSHLMIRLVKYTTENFVTEEKARDVENFFKKHPTSGTERIVQQCIETIRLNAAWLERDKESMEQYLKAFGNQ